MLKGKTILLGVTGGIAAYKAAALASALVKQRAHVEVIMTAHATEFIAPLTFEQLTGNRCMVDTFDRNFSHQVEHIALADRTDLVLIAPATANVCGKLAHGLADDMLTTTVLACTCPKLIAPAMNTKMFENPVTQDNLDILRRYGWEVIAPASGRLACGAVGAGKLPEPEVLLQHILRQTALPHDLAGKHVLVTAGPTQEALDPVRYLTNHSTGKMGYALARMAMLRGADVVLVSGPAAVPRTCPATAAPVRPPQARPHGTATGCGHMPPQRIRPKPGPPRPRPPWSTFPPISSALWSPGRGRRRLYPSTARTASSTRRSMRRRKFCPWCGQAAIASGTSP